MASGLRVGLTGGIACGKSVVTRRLAEAGLSTLDLDVIAHEVMAPGGAAHQDVVAAFGEAILAADGTIDRKVLGARVFTDEGARRRLNAIVHPVVRREEARRAAALARDPGAIVVTDAALLVESGFHLRFDRLVVVHCAPEVQMRRLTARDGIEEKAARARLDAQMPIDEKRRFAHFDVDTNGSLEETVGRADELGAMLRRLCREPPPPAALRPSQAIACLACGPREGPRGLRPTAVLRDLVEARGIEMERLRSLLVPPGEGPWFRAAPEAEDHPLPATLAGALTLWQVAQGAADDEALLAAVASVARLTHRSPAAIGNACVLALAMLATAAPPASPRPSLAQRLHQWRGRAERWAGERFPDAVGDVLRAVDHHPGDLAAARSAARGAGADPDLAGALFGLGAGADEDASASGEVEEVVNALLTVSGSRARD